MKDIICTVKEMVEELNRLDPRANILSMSDHQSPCGVNPIDYGWYDNESEYVNFQYDELSLLLEKTDKEGVYKIYDGKKYYLTAIVSST